MTDTATQSTTDVIDVDVAVIGAGFAGLYALHKLRNDLGLDVQSFENGSDVGGTWFWNQYPGARSDTEVTAYCYSFDRDLFAQWKWSQRYPRQKEIHSRHPRNRPASPARSTTPRAGPSTRRTFAASGSR